MRTRFLLVAALLLSTSVGADLRRPPDPKICTCETARINNGWCRPCKVGYVAAVRIPSAKLFEVLDAHGHAIDPIQIRCSSCKKAMTTDGYCDRCRMGFIKKQAYLSKLAYLAQKGRVMRKSPLSCKTCLKNAKTTGWCDRCNVGIAGQLAFKTRAETEEAHRQLQILRRALRTLKRCETCAIATVCGGRCRHCDISYREGKPVKRRKIPKNPTG